MACLGLLAKNILITFQVVSQEGDAIKAVPEMATRSVLEWNNNWW